MVEFVSDHCSVCKEMRPPVPELEHRCTQGRIVRIDIDAPSGRQLAVHYGVSMVPTFLSIDPAGGAVERIIGEQSMERLIGALYDPVA